MFQRHSLKWLQNPRYIIKLLPEGLHDNKQSAKCSLQKEVVYVVLRA
jgi:hypothetical protein